MMTKTDIQVPIMGKKRVKVTKKKTAKPNPKAPLGQGGRFAALKQDVAAKGATNPGALAAWIGRKKFGKARFQKLAAAGRRQA